MSVRDERGIRIRSRIGCAPAFGLAPPFARSLPGMPWSCARIDLGVGRRPVSSADDRRRVSAAGLEHPRPDHLWRGIAAFVLFCRCGQAFLLQPLPATAVDLCDEVAALTDAAASAATSSATAKAAAVANLRGFTDSSPLDSNFFSPPPQTALQQTSLPSRPSPPFRTSSFPPIRTCPAGSTSGAGTPCVPEELAHLVMTDIPSSACGRRAR